VLSLFIGTYYIAPGTVLQVLFNGITGPFSSSVSSSSVYWTILFNLRLPRIVLALVGGIVLSVTGASLQGVFKNPLVDSYILGVSAGAGFGAAIAIAFLPDLLAMSQILAFSFGVLAFLLTFFAARTKGETPIVSLVLGGIIVTALFSAGISLIEFFTNPDQLAGVVYWLMGSLSSATWGGVLDILPITVAGFMVIFLMRWRLNVLSMGEEEAKSMGVDVGRDRLIVLTASTLMVSAIVSVTGIIGWIGLVVPHIVRMSLGTPDNRVVIPVSASVGAVFLILADDLSRSLATFELPVGLLTTLIGAPFFLYLLKKRGGMVWK
jgi:iron complex transport system permease protein